MNDVIKIILNAVLNGIAPATLISRNVIIWTLPHKSFFLLLVLTFLFNNFIH
jgi:hypothetical protein